MLVVGLCLKFHPEPKVWNFVCVLQSPLKSPNWDAIIQQYGDMDKWNTPAILKGPNIFDFVTPGTPRSATVTTYFYLVHTRLFGFRVGAFWRKILPVVNFSFVTCFRYMQFICLFIIFKTVICEFYKLILVPLKVSIMLLCPASNSDLFHKVTQNSKTNNSKKECWNFNISGFFQDCQRSDPRALSRSRC